ncbi:terpene synthase family protein [Streptomyces sp. NPDC091279]|uniref:terpene synthase family protein n=1 Tax=Streptomyces sp. NPDC091279 TaxID=3365983 RepID=UPI003829B1E3
MELGSRELPEFYLPFPEQAGHPEAAEIEAAACAWARERGLVDEAGWRRVTASRVVSAGTGCYDRAGRAEMDILARWYVWSLVVADDLDGGPRGESAPEWSRRSAALVADLTAVFQGRAVPDGARHGPLFSAVADDLWPRTAERMSADWQHRFADHHHACLAAYRWQAAVRNGILPAPTLADYITRRRFSYGGYVFFDLIDLVEGVRLTERFYAERTWHDLTAAASDAMAWTNDIISLPKDLRDGERTNLLVLARGQLGGTWRECADQANAMVSERLRQFLYAYADLPYTVSRLGLDAEALTQAQQLAARLGAKVRASLNWHLRSARYTAENGTAPAPTDAPPSP